MRIAIIGTRGIPNSYGGFEELAEKLSVFLSKKGHEVFVYNPHRHEYQAKSYNGVTIIHKYDPEHRIGTIGQFFYDLFCILNSRKLKPDIVLQLGYTSSSVWWWLLPKSGRVLTNMDGLEWKRSKYSGLVKRFLKKAESWAAKHSHLLIADNPEIEKYLSKNYKNQKVYIPYGAHIPSEIDGSLLNKYNVTTNGYYLILARMEPENNIEMIIKGVLQSESKKPLLIIGNLETKFGKKLRKKYTQKNIRFIPSFYDKAELNALRFHCRLYFHGHSVGGTNPSLLEAMACQSLLASHQNNFNKNVLGEHSFYFLDETDVSNIIDHADLDLKGPSYKKENLNKIREIYNWRIICEQYEITMQQLAIG